MIIRLGLEQRICVEAGIYIFSVDPMNSAQDSQVRNSVNITLKLSPTVLFTYLKIILLQYFQFLVFNNKQYPNRPLMPI